MNEQRDNATLVDLAGQRAHNFYAAHGLCCSEAIVFVLNKGFGGNLSAEMAVSLGSGLCGGMGGGDSVCGALSGAVVALGSLLGPNQKGGLSKGKMRKTSNTLQSDFKKKFGSDYCKDLTEEFAGDRKAKMRNCGIITMETAKLATELLLEKKPALAKKADMEFLKGKDSKGSVLLKKLLGRKTT